MGYRGSGGERVEVFVDHCLGFGSVAALSESTHPV